MSLLATHPMRAQTTSVVAPKSKGRLAHGDCRLCHGVHANMRLTKASPKKTSMVSPLHSEFDTACLYCHQGPSLPATDQGASKLSMWSGSGSSHFDGPFLDRAKGYVRVVDMGPRHSPLLRAECTGCHDMHAKDQPANLLSTAFDAFGKPMKVKPTTIAQTCFGCHAGQEAVRIPRADHDLGTLFQPSAVSAHRPGEKGTGRFELPSLRLGLTKRSLDCTSCHDNPNPAGPRGPHASPFPHLLKASYGREGDVGMVGDRMNDLCFTCHDRTSILSNQSFPWHAQHVAGFTAASKVVGPATLRPSSRQTQVAGVGFRGLSAGSGSSAGVGQPAACATCHDPHGSVKYPALIAFDKNVVTRSSVGAIDYQRSGLGHGTCTLSCHGYDHVQTRY